MTVRRIRVENFGKYKEKEFGIEGRKLYVVSGSNGAGKSTLFVESLGWCFYGDMWRGGQRDDVIKDGEGWCRVVVETDVGVVERRRERGKGSVVKIDGRICGEVEVQSLLKLTRDMFFNAVIFGSAVSGFLFLSDGEKKEMLAEIVYRGLDDMVDKLKAYRKDVSEKLKVLGREFEYVNSGMKRIREKLKDFVDEKDVNGLIVVIEEKRKELERLSDMVGQLKEGIDECLKERESLEDRSKELERKYKDKDKELAIKRSDLRKLIARLQELDHLVVCYVCGQEVTSAYKEKLVDGVVEEMRGLEKDIEDLEQWLVQLNGELVEVRGAVAVLKSKENDLRQPMDSIMPKWMGLQQELRELEVKVEKEKELQRIRMEYVRELEELEVSRVGLEKELKQLEIEEQACGYWMEVFTRYKAELFGRVIDVLGGVANDILVKLGDGRFTVDVGVDVKGRKRIGEKFVLDLYDRSTKVLYSRLSGGEKRLVGLGLNLALNYVLSKVYADDWNILVFDEVFDALDGGVREKVVDLLLDMVVRTGKTIIVITHDEFGYRESAFEKVVL